jgi:hypothetical protein
MTKNINNNNNNNNNIDTNLQITQVFKYDLFNLFIFLKYKSSNKGTMFVLT